MDNKMIHFIQKRFYNLVKNGKNGKKWPIVKMIGNFMI